MEKLQEWLFLTDESTAASRGLRGPAVDCLKDGTWDLLPEAWREYFVACDMDAVCAQLNRLATPVGCDPSLATFVQRVRDSCKPCPRVEAQVALSKAEARGLKQKKQREIEVFAAVVADHCRKLGIDHVIDVGAGQGYLARTLAFVFGLHVVALERDVNNAELGSKKAKDVPERQQGSLRFEAVTIGCAADICRVVERPCVLVALHACGTLSVCVQEAFLQCDRIVGLLNVPCCYSKRVTNEREQRGYFVSRKYAAAPLNEGSLLAASCSSVLVVSQATVFRCMLSLLCAELNLPAPEKVRVSKGPKSFFDYVRANLDQCDEEKVREFDARNRDVCERRVKALWTLKNVLGHAIERLVLLDRAEMMREAGQACDLVQLFDAAESPRCVCLVCHKRAVV
jgi:predicted RNA methylase